MILFYFISPVTIVMHLHSFSKWGHYQIYQLELEL